ncbi:MAG TPA: P-loop NTPase fold protein [bacterium]|nr:P-loop NTPase fold protein [bacterium]
MRLKARGPKRDKGLLHRGSGLFESRIKFARDLTRFVSNIEDGLTISLNAPWGDGKTVFIDAWREDLDEKKIKNIYFNAFQDDFNDDPFIALSANIIEFIKENGLDKDSSFKKSALRIAKTVSVAAMRAGIAFFSKEALDGVDRATNVLSDAALSVGEKYLDEKYESYLDSKNSLKALKESLDHIIKELPGNQKKIIFIVDELDRCRPDYAIGVLERIKHFFEVDGLIFVIAMNRKQIESYVKGQFGADVDASLYLQKFINYECSLPKKSGAYGLSSELDMFCQAYYASNGFVDKNGSTDMCKEFFEIFCGIPSFLAKIFKMTPREIQDSFRNLAVCHGCIPDYINYPPVLIAFFSVIKVIRPALYAKFKDLSVSLDDLSEFKFLMQEDKIAVEILAYINLYMGFGLSADEKKYFEARGFQLDRFKPDKNVIPEMCGYIELFNPSF